MSNLTFHLPASCSQSGSSCPHRFSGYRDGTQELGGSGVETTWVHLDSGVLFLEKENEQNLVHFIRRGEMRAADSLM